MQPLSFDQETTHLWAWAAHVSICCHFAGKERLLQILSPVCGGLMWRNSMADVAADLGLPPQHQRKTDLQLSAIERHFYTRQHQACNL